MKLFVWDFHGVLETGNENAVVEITNLALDEFGYDQRLSFDDCDMYYGLKWYEYFENILPQVPHAEHIRLQKRCFDISESHPDIIAKYIKQNRYARDVINAIGKSHQQILISNTYPSSLDMFLKVVKLGDSFSKDNIFAVDAHKKTAKRSKKDVLKHFIKSEKREYVKIISIGDSVSDIQLVENYPNTTTYLYSHPNRKHKNANATYKINDLRKILEIEL